MQQDSDKASPEKELGEGDSVEVLQEIEPGLTREDALQWLHKHKLEEQRKRLDPSTLPEILARLASLTERARALVHGEARRNAMAPGFDLLIAVVRDLQFALPPFLPDTHQKAGAVLDDLRTRHSKGLDSVVPWALLLVANNVLEDAARPMTKDKAKLAVTHVRAVLGQHLRQDVTDKTILKAVRTFRKPRAGKGNQRKGSGVASDKDRMAALKSIILFCFDEQDERDEQDMANHLWQLRRDADERIEALTGQRKREARPPAASKQPKKSRSKQ